MSNFQLSSRVLYLGFFGFSVHEFLRARMYFASVLLGALQNKNGTSLAIKSKEKMGKEDALAC